ncbi:MAG: chromosome partitioning protein [Candidatus Lambdaproteobacteria bacterium RIFOXYD1_FULL_56_27]|uniref:Chromosome partitioning protein n=1 Tax=Candidatus Lambdaproteobacteria bacterium RIFOXYD2_FULL_56_26 TaxID=1817773 RepID=A0A1F6GWB9_9PROT|nr:MAG: chromosome partitioning protein [Candidatus Lambdaproteobacteria bacterium RIFOXYD2_FULL_56_26]OGH07550.1 MAG: chromosome partitioning protein [Candidatus Lambdaproteobacteria bacterium RIFOXYD1_FULL_56_27]
MGTILTMFNNKGGVSKTTTIFNLAVFLASEQKVLLVDCDPQCNATELFFASHPELDTPDFELPGTSIYEAMRPRFEGEVGVIDVNVLELTQSSEYSNLYLLRGDQQFSRAEDYLGTAWAQAITENVNEKKTYVAFSRMLSSLMDAHKFKYILCDIGPSTGAINRTVLMACDGFYMPLIPDRFCDQAVQVLGPIISGWVKKHKEISKTLKPFKIEPFAGEPKLFGAIIQNYKVRSGRAKKAYDAWHKVIQGHISTNLLSAGGLELAPKTPKQNPFVASIRDVGPLAPVAQKVGRAIFDLKAEHSCESSENGKKLTGVAWEYWVKLMKEYKEEIQKISKVL